MALQSHSTIFRLDYWIEVIFAGLPLIPAAMFGYWMFRLNRDLRSGRRVRLTWKEMSLPKKAYWIALVGYFVLVIYIDLSAIVPAMTSPRTAFSDTLRNAIVSLWMVDIGLLGIGFLAEIRTPPRKTNR